MCTANNCLENRPSDRTECAQRELDVAGAGREVDDEVVQVTPVRRRQQLLDEACVDGSRPLQSLQELCTESTSRPLTAGQCVTPDARCSNRHATAKATAFGRSHNTAIRGRKRLRLTRHHGAAHDGGALPCKAEGHRLHALVLHRRQRLRGSQAKHNQLEHGSRQALCCPEEHRLHALELHGVSACAHRPHMNEILGGKFHPRLWERQAVLEPCERMQQLDHAGNVRDFR